MITNNCFKVFLSLAFCITFCVAGLSQSQYPVTTENGKSYHIYTVQKSEGLYAISKKFNVAQNEIIIANPEINDGLKVGQKIKIPISNNNIVNSSNTSGLTHTVVAGETLYSLANTYGTTVDELIRINPGLENGLKSGSTIIIPKESGGYIYHTIQEKETLFSVSKKYELTQDDILATNPGLSASTFNIGKVIRLDATKIQKNRAEKIEKERIANSSFVYVAEQKEKVEDIAKKFNVTVNDLKKINPKLPKKLSKGDKIMIPSPKVTQEITTIQNYSTNATISKNSTAQIALMLPFMVNVKDKKSERERMTEYYEGFLMALSDAKQKGFSTDVYVYDIQNQDDIKKILANPKMKEMNLIIGPAYDDNVDIVSTFTKENKIPLVIPFTSKNDSYQTNPFIYQINAPTSFFYSKASEVFIKEFKNQNIIILSADNVSEEKADFINALTSLLKQQNISWQKVHISGTNTNTLDAALSSGKKNIIVPTFSSLAALEKTLPQILKLKEKNTSKNIALFGYPEWQTYKKTIHSTYFHPIDTYIFSSFYASLSSSETTKFRTDFMKVYSKEIMPTFPKFALMGYDTGKFFISAIQKFGYNFHDNINSNYYHSGLQMNLHFERMNYWSGFINRNVYFIHFETNNTVTHSSYR